MASVGQRNVRKNICALDVVAGHGIRHWLRERQARGSCHSEG